MIHVIFNALNLSPLCLGKSVFFLLEPHFDKGQNLSTKQFHLVCPIGVVFVSKLLKSQLLPVFYEQLQTHLGKNKRWDG